MKIKTLVVVRIWSYRAMIFFRVLQVFPIDKDENSAPPAPKKK